MCCRRWDPPGDPAVPSLVTAATLRDKRLQSITLQWEWPPSCPAPAFLLYPFPTPGVPRGQVGAFGVPAISAHISSWPLQMFKGPDKDIEFIYTAPSSAVCGVSLDVGGKKEYLIAGGCVARYGTPSWGLASKAVARGEP